MNGAVLEAVREVTDVANERRKWRALSASVADMEQRAGGMFRAQRRDVKRGLASWRTQWPVHEAVWPTYEAALPERIGEFVERILGRRRSRDAARLRPPLELAMAAAIRVVGIAHYGISFTLEDVGATAYMKVRGAELVAELNAATVDDLRAILSRGVSEGWSYDRTAKAIIEKYASYAVPRGQYGIATRAHLIAVTENAFAYEASHLAMARDMEAAGLPMLKEWGASSDACDVCLGNAGEGALPLEQAFGSGDLMPPAHPACRCFDETYVDPAAVVSPDITVHGQTPKL